VFIERTRISAFEAVDWAIAGLEEAGVDLVLVDSHAEATSEKQALGHHLAGRVQAMVV
jgi:calcineurin-like phosphoesterase